MSDDSKGPPKIDVEQVLAGDDTSVEQPPEVEILPSEATAGKLSSAAQSAEEEGLAERHLRLRADFENFRRRSRREMEELRGQAAGELLARMLPVLDSLERALESPTDVEALREGVDLIRRQMWEVMAAAGLEPIDALGEPFDPEVHEAFAREERDDLPANLVVEELRRGYRLGGKVLRPSLVRVAVPSGDKPDGGAAGEDEVR